jgi:hypothetical protein
MFNFYFGLLLLTFGVIRHHKGIATLHIGPIPSVPFDREYKTTSLSTCVTCNGVELLGILESGQLCSLQIGRKNWREEGD